MWYLMGGINSDRQIIYFLPIFDESEIIEM